MKLSKTQAQIIIKDAQIVIADAMKKYSDLEPQVKEYKDAYMKLQNDLDSTKEKIEGYKEILRVASEVFNGVKTGQAFRVLRSESHDEMKPREKRKIKVRYRWVSMAISILSNTQQYMSKDDLWDAIRQGTDLPANGKIRFDAMNTCIGKSKKFHIHRDYIGLDGWQSEISKHYRHAV
jgi:hypothetical protein